MKKVVVAIIATLCVFTLSGMCCNMVDCLPEETMIDGEAECPEGKTCYETNCGANQCVTDADGGMGDEDGG